MHRHIWTTLGFLCLALGLIGAALPVMPTTPFVLLAAFAFGRGSPRLRHRLETDPRFGPAILRWETHGAIAPRHKLISCVAMTASVALSLAIGVPPIALAIQVVCIAGAMLFVLTRPDGPRQE